NGEVLGILYFFVNDVYPRLPYKYSVTSFILNTSLYLAIKTPPKLSFITLTFGGRYPLRFFSLCMLFLFVERKTVSHDFVNGSYCNKSGRICFCNNTF